MSAAVRSSFLVFRIRPAGRSGESSWVALHERHHRDAGFESRQAERELREQQQRHEQHRHRVAVLHGERVRPARQVLGMCEHLPDADGEHDDVEREVDGDDDHRQANGFAKPFQEDRAESGQQHDRDGNRVIERRGHERVVDDVLGRVGGGERNRDDEVGCGESEQHEHEGLAAPARQQILEHRDAALSVRAGRGDPAVNRQRAHERQDDENQRRDGRERAGREKRDARLVSERREVIDARQAHHLPPRRLMNRRRVRPLGGLSHSLEKPVPKTAAVRLRDAILHHLRLLALELVCVREGGRHATRQSTCQGSHSMKFHSAATLATRTTSAASRIVTIEACLRMSITRLSARDEMARW